MKTTPQTLAFNQKNPIASARTKNMTYSQITRNQRTIDGHLGFVVTGVDRSGCLNWKADCWIVNGSSEVEVQGNRDWKVEDVTAMLESIHIKRVGF